VKQSKSITIANRVFSLVDLQRIAQIFQKQQELANKSDHRAVSKYLVKFSNSTSVESDSPEILNDEVLAVPARPVQVAFSFHDFAMDQHLSIDLMHGESSYGNSATVRGSETAWLNDNFAALSNAIETARPQNFWFRQHPLFLLHLIAFGVGSFANLMFMKGLDMIVAFPPPQLMRRFPCL
jgi:hypothetical protein